MKEKVYTRGIFKRDSMAVEEKKRILRQEIRQKMGNFLSYFVEGRQFLLVEVYHIIRGFVTI